ncbi:NAD(+)/NADH kinase [Spirochaetia bacterium 38H-sp]|uniref:NAD kinase n=1 Tax=Rarispira pelagica TaxID=3141764 RepID=A0ABU9UEV3_9SPIR
MCRVLIVANLSKSLAHDILSDVRDRLSSAGCVVDVWSDSKVFDFSSYSLAVSIGGDGTVLFASRLLAGSDVPLLPINAGRLGFLAESGRDEWWSLFDNWREGRALPVERLMLSVSVVRKDGVVRDFVALNDVVVSSQGISKIVKLSVELHGCMMGEYHADGIIIATPTGSTAYSAAAGGAILHPDVEAFIITPICAFSLASRPVVTPAREPVCVRVMNEQRSDVMLTIDGQEVFSLLPGDVIRVEDRGVRAKVLLLGSLSFYELLRTKLRWSGGPVYA